jgi:arsenical pump membrane protein
MGAVFLSRSRIFAVVGLLGAIAAAVADPDAARAAARQNWPPFVLVVGLLLIGLVADRDGLFRALGRLIGDRARSGIALYAGMVLVVAGVTAVLNLDTSVAFLTPILVYTAARRGGGEAPLLYGCLLLSNAASLLLPGSNLTNLIVLGHLHLSGSRFFTRMAPAWAASVIVTAIIVAVAEHRELRSASAPTSEHAEPTWPVTSVIAVAVAVVLVLVLQNPALPVLAVGVALMLVRLRERRVTVADARPVLGLSTLVGLFTVAVALGALGRDWSGPTRLLAHLDAWGTAFVAAGVSVVVNNLPAASLLAARAPHHPLALLIGLNLGPNVFVTGSLSWLLWLRAARTAGARPSVAHATRLGVLVTPVSIAVAVAALSATASR